MGINHLYIHVPFCKAICYYCDFCHRVYDEKLAERWLDRLSREAEENCKDQYETIYIGGGTPTTLNDTQLKRLLEMIDPFAERVMEYTIEVNPESLDQRKIDIMKKHGINRVSMGLQSADDNLLKTIGRRHSFDDVKDRIALLKDNGISNISIDLMYSLPGQTMQILQDTLNKALDLNIPHISLYSLTVEENSVFGKKGISSLDEDIEADMYELIEQRLSEKGYIHYEVSNYCLNGYESRHNLGYWNYDDFLGLSLGAAGKIGNSRYTNTRSFEKYFNETDIRDEDLHLSREEMMFENIMMSLRTIYGLDIEAFNRKYDCDLLKEYPKGVNNPGVKVDHGRLVCTDLAVLNRVLLDFMD
ncbi:MAG: radical SAM family heme chaperone HemW [Erysipelotrichaceae bacterium]|nr:radical SAM family heme chaperone HemW [Erysipelotrichaceae bacterium]